MPNGSLDEPGESREGWAGAEGSGELVWACSYRSAAAEGTKQGSSGAQAEMAKAGRSLVWMRLVMWQLQDSRPSATGGTGTQDWAMLALAAAWPG